MKILTASAILIAAATICPAQTPAFDVASIRLNNNPGRPNPVIQYSPDTLTMRQVSLWLSLRWAYGMESFQISGPDSMQVPPLYDIVAKAVAPVPESQLRSMLRTLLADRFHLTVHTENREMPVWALLVAKGGQTFQESDGKYDPARGAEMPFRFLGFGDDVHLQRSIDPGGRLRDSFSNMPMLSFAGVLALMGSVSPYDKVPVVDMTGLPGRYDLVLSHDRPQTQEGNGPQAPDDVFADLKPILEKELGLTLERRKAMVDILVVDHIDKTPTDN